MANLTPNAFAWYLNSAGWSAVAAWIQNHGYTCGNLVRQLATPTVGQERVFVCGVAGTTNNTGEPTWTLTRYGATTDGTVTWYECTGNPALNGDFTNCLTWALQHASSIAVTVGLIIYDSVSGSLQIITTAGNLGSSAPTFSATAGTVTSETGAGTAKWTSLGAASGFTIWKAPFARAQSAVASTWGVAGNTFFTSASHAETQASAMTITVPISGSIAATTSFVCVSNTPATTPPGGGDVTTGASISTTGASTLTINESGGGSAYEWNGFTISAGSGAVTSSLSISGANTGESIFDNCALKKAGTSQANSAFVFGVGVTYLNNTTLQFGNVGDLIEAQTGTLIWRNTASAIAGTPPTSLIEGQETSVFQFEGVDLSAITGTIFSSIGSNTPLFRALLVNCKLASGVLIVAAGPLNPGIFVDVLFSGASGVAYGQQRYRGTANLTQSTSIVRTGGAISPDGSTPMSWAITTSSIISWLNRFECPGSWIYNGTTASNVAVILYGIWFGSALPNNDQIWHDVQYFGSASSPLASLGSGTKANNLASGSAWAADTSAWDSQATARLNSTVYAVGNIFKQSGSPGSLFIVTAIGSSPHQSAASPPAGYTSAADGAVITDGNLTVQAAYRFSMTVTLSAPQPQLAGYLYSYVKAALASSTFYIDPQIVL